MRTIRTPIPYFKKHADFLERDLQSADEERQLGALCRIARARPALRDLNLAQLRQSLRHTDALDVIAFEQGHGNWELFTQFVDLTERSDDEIAARFGSSPGVLSEIGRGGTLDLTIDRFWEIIRDLHFRDLLDDADAHYPHMKKENEDALRGMLRRALPTGEHAAAANRILSELCHVLTRGMNMLHGNDVDDLRSNDSTDDAMMHIIGLGQAAYEEAVARPDLVEDRIVNGPLYESVAYFFPGLGAYGGADRPFDDDAVTLHASVTAYVAAQEARRPQSYEAAILRARRTPTATDRA